MKVLSPLHKPQLFRHFSCIFSPELHWFDKAHDGHLGSESVQSVNVSKRCTKLLHNNQTPKQLINLKNILLILFINGFTS